MNTQSTVLPVERRRAIRRQRRTALLVLASLFCLCLAAVLAFHALLWLALAAAAGFVGFGWPAFLGLADPQAGEER